MKSKTKILLYLITILALPASAQAHPIGGSGIMSSITHLFLGVDHLLAMVAVVIISAQIGAKAIWKVPKTFVSFMVRKIFTNN